MKQQEKKLVSSIQSLYRNPVGLINIDIYVGINRELLTDESLEIDKFTRNMVNLFMPRRYQTNTIQNQLNLGIPLLLIRV